jgi:transitional endoplasmic reticulum ATPase
VPPDDYRRCRLIHWPTWCGASRAQEFAEHFRRSFRLGWSQTKGRVERKAVSESEKDCPAQTFLAAPLPITTVFIAFRENWLLTISILLALQVSLWWALLVPLRHAPWFLRKILRILVMTGFAVDAALTVWWLNFHAPRPLTINSDAGVALELLILLAWWILLFVIVFSRPRRRSRPAQGNGPTGYEGLPTKPVPELRVPKIRFADVGGMEDAKQQIREVVESRLNRQKYAAYGVNRNGILLYGPRGSGKTFLAEATAGEFGLNFHYVSPTRFITMWVGESESGIRGAFSRALANRPALLFIDEIDSLGSIRQNLGTGGDPGGAGRSYNNMAIELMQSIDHARTESGLVVMAASNVIDGLDEALIRDGRFDVKIHLDLPDETTRERIFRAQLAAKPWAGFELKEFARRTPGASAAKIRSLVDQAAIFAARDGRKIEARDLQKALEEYGGKDRPLFQPVEWEDVVLDEHVEQELRSLIRLVSNPFAAERMGLRVPTGLLLLGPTGTGKTMLARLIATQSTRSFLPITSAEITEPKSVARVFARARENSPSLIFIDEMDSLVPGNPGYLNQYYVQIVEQFLIEISALQPEHNVFLVGTTNHPEKIDPRVLRGGRFSEKIEVGAPGRREVARLLANYLKGVELEPSLSYDFLTEWLTGRTPGNLEAMIATAKRYAFDRSGEDRLAPLRLDDFERAAVQVMGQAPPLRSARSTQA